MAALDRPLGRVAGFEAIPAPDAVLMIPGDLLVRLPQGLPTLQRDHPEVQAWLAMATFTDGINPPQHTLAHDTPEEMTVDGSPYQVRFSASGFNGVIYTGIGRIYIAQVGGALSPDAPVAAAVFQAKEGIFVYAGTPQDRASNLIDV